MQDGTLCLSRRSRRCFNAADVMATWYPPARRGRSPKSAEVLHPERIGDSGSGVMEDDVSAAHVSTKVAAVAIIESAKCLARNIQTYVCSLTVVKQLKSGEASGARDMAAGPVIKDLNSVWRHGSAKRGALSGGKVVDM